MSKENDLSLEDQQLYETAMSYEDIRKTFIDSGFVEGSSIFVGLVLNAIQDTSNFFGFGNTMPVKPDIQKKAFLMRCRWIESAPELPKKLKNKLTQTITQIDGMDWQDKSSFLLARETWKNMSEFSSQTVNRSKKLSAAESLFFEFWINRQ